MEKDGHPQILHLHVLQEANIIPNSLEEDSEYPAYVDMHLFPVSCS